MQTHNSSKAVTASRTQSLVMCFGRGRETISYESDQGARETSGRV